MAGSISAYEKRARPSDTAAPSDNATAVHSTDDRAVGVIRRSVPTKTKALQTSQGFVQPAWRPRPRRRRRTAQSSARAAARSIRAYALWLWIDSKFSTSTT